MTNAPTHQVAPVTSSTMPMLMMSVGEVEVVVAKKRVMMLVRMRFGSVPFRFVLMLMVLIMLV